MGSGFRSANFYAVGGPVQPDRACYIKRDADDLLLRHFNVSYDWTLSPSNAPSKNGSYFLQASELPL